MKIYKYCFCSNAKISNISQKYFTIFCKQLFCKLYFLEYYIEALYLLSLFLVKLQRWRSATQLKINSLQGYSTYFDLKFTEIKHIQKFSEHINLHNNPQLLQLIKTRKITIELKGKSIIMPSMPALTYP